MLSDKRYMRFFQFTQHNLDALSGSLMVPLQSKWLLSGVFLSFFFSIFLGKTYIIPIEKKQPEPIHKVKQVISVKQEPKYKSAIPAFHLAATRQILYTIPLRKAEQIVIHEEEAFNTSWVVMDKVIVIPKKIG